MIVDTHVHVWRYPDHFDRAAMIANQPARRRGWSDEKFKAMWDNPVERYFEAAAGVVDKAIVLPLQAKEAFGITVPNEYVAALKRQYPDRLEWACNVDPLAPGAVEEVERCVVEWGAVAVGEFGPPYQGFYVDDRRIYPLYEKMQELEVPLVVHAGPVQSKNLRMKYGDVLRVDDVAIDFPRLKIVICHMGYYRYDDAIHLSRKHDNVFLDCSWLTQLGGLDRVSTPKHLPAVRNPYFHLLHPLMRYWAEAWGSTDKIIWGSDWTGTHPRESLETLLGLNALLQAHGFPPVPQRILDDVVHENWKQVYPRLAQAA